MALTFYSGHGIIHTTLQLNRDAYQERWRDRPRETSTTKLCDGCAAMVPIPAVPRGGFWQMSVRGVNANRLFNRLAPVERSFFASLLFDSASILLKSYDQRGEYS